MSLDNDSFTVLELFLQFGDPVSLGKLQRILNNMTKAKQAMVSLEDEEAVTTLCWDRRLDLEIPL